MMRVAIFGGSGFVGSFLVDALIAAGHEPSLMVRLGSERKVRQAKRCRLVAGNLSSTTAIDATLENCAAVIYSVGILKESPKQGITFEELQCPSSNKWNMLSVWLMESFVPRLHIMRRVAHSANDVSRWSSV